MMTGTDEAVMPERRSEGRRRVLKGAVLSFNKGFSTFECVVRNMSERGAQISFSELFPMPLEFGLWIDGHPRRRAVIRWRSTEAIGVEYLPA